MTPIVVWSLRAAGQGRTPERARELLRRAACEARGHAVFNKHRPGLAPMVDGLAASLARTDDVAMVALGDCLAIGIDVERLRTFDDLRDIVPLMTDTRPDDAWGVLTLWTRKEALAKATGAGLPDDVRSLAVPDAPVEVGSWLRHDGWMWVGCPCEDGCVAALVVKSLGPDAQGNFDIVERHMGEPGVRAWSLLLPI